ncbi:ABC transporter ATP-binding protein [Taklimakanibacter deserti]|uniref:ABC transporter ATP-binding protein n=1 Tax=Taklimakanibacter deserti TaxID=2267839 RepID=UPI000E65DB2E
MTDTPLLQARDLHVRFNAVRAVDGVDLDVQPGETLAIVGESGCGKTTLGRALAMLQKPSTGSISFAGTELTGLSARRLRDARRQLQMVFQDPYASLDPRQRVGDIVGEPLLIAGVAKAARRKKVAELLDMVGLGADMALRFPREFSGGQRQRIGIARALAIEPRLIICDEPLSALDVSIQAQIVNLLIDLQRRFRLTYVFISHDLAVVRQMASRVAVMYLGRIVELAETEALFQAPRHPYTVALLSAVPTLAGTEGLVKEEILLTGDPPSPARVPLGCRFHTRCWLRKKLDDPSQCLASEPKAEGEGHHVAACHFADKVASVMPASSHMRKSKGAA